MAAPITHIVLSNKVFQTHFSHLDRDSFFVGTSFPDIRYLGNIDRTKTHFKNLTLDDIKNSEAFMAGVKFHSYLDDVREDFIVSKNLYSFVPESPFVTQAVKFLEDKIFYNRIDNWNNYINYFKTVTKLPVELQEASPDFERWNALIANYLSKLPDSSSVVGFVNDINKPVQMATEINRIVTEIESKPEVLNVLESLYQEFDNLIVSN